MENIILKPIGYVSNNRSEIIDDTWGEVASTITLTPDTPNSCL